MHSSQLMRASACTLSCVVFAGVIGGGCGGEATGKTTPTGEPKTPVTSCSITSDMAVSQAAATGPAIAYRSGRFAVAWVDTSNDVGAVRLSLLDHDGHTIHEEPIAVSAAIASSPAVAATSEGFFVAWQEETTGKPTAAGGDQTDRQEEAAPGQQTGGGEAGATVVKGMHINQDGMSRGAAFEISTAASKEAHPNVATVGDETAITWTESTGAVIAKVSDAGVTGKVALPGATLASVGGGDDKLVAAWATGQKLSYSPIEFADDTTKLEAMTTLRAAAGKANMPRVAVASDGTIAAVWEAAVAEDKEEIFIAFSGQDQKTAAEIQVSPADASANCPDVAWIGKTAGVVYYQFREGPPSVYLSLVTPGEARAGQELRISTGSRFARIALGDNATLGIAYAQRNGPVRLATVTCK